MSYNSLYNEVLSQLGIAHVSLLLALKRWEEKADGTNAVNAMTAVSQYISTYEIAQQVAKHTQNVLYPFFEEALKRAEKTLELLRKQEFLLVIRAD
jgi:hypothetical protein